MSAPYAFLITYSNGHTVVQAAEDVLEQTGFSVSRGSATRQDLDGGAFELTSTEDGRTRCYEPVTTEPPEARRFRELVSEDGLAWQDTGIVPSSYAGRLCARNVNRGLGRVCYLASGAMVVIDTVLRRQTLRYEPVEA